MLDFLWNIWQQQEIHRAQADASAAGQKASNATMAFAEMERRLDALTLASMAMWSLLSERLGVSDAELEARMLELDLGDGVRDGKVTAGSLRCTACGRTVNGRRETCLYCGGQLTGKDGGSPFDRAR